jgi:superfamily I DNA and/or RNA helicase
LYDAIEDAGIFRERVNGPILWIDKSSIFIRDPSTLSLSNMGEKDTTKRLAEELSDIFGAGMIMVASPYRGQVRFCHISTLSVKY